MGHEYRIINPLTYPGWDDLLISHCRHSFFHTSYWARVLSDAYGYEPLYFSGMDSGRLTALIPVMDVNSLITGRRGVSLPFSDYCMPVVADSAQFEEMKHTILEHGRKSGWKYLEVRGGEDCGCNIAPLRSYYGHTLDLARQEKDIFSTFRSDIRRSLKNAGTSELAVSFDTTIETLNEFYRLNCLTRKRHGIPPQPYRFFHKIFEHVLSKEKGFVALASHNNKVLAGAVFFHFGKKAVYKYGASDNTGMQTGINKIIMWQAIKYYRQSGYESLCFGRTEPENDGLRYYKTGWGTREETINYYKYDVATGKAITNGAPLSALARKFYRRVPLTISRMIGSAVYRHGA